MPLAASCINCGNLFTVEHDIDIDAPLCLSCYRIEKLLEYVRHKNNCLAGQRYLWKGKIIFYQCTCGLNNLLKQLEKGRKEISC